MTTTIASQVGPVALPEKTEAAPNNDNKPPAAAIAAIIMTPTGRFGLDGDCMTVRTSSYWSDKSVPILHFDEPLRTGGELSQIRGCSRTHIVKFPDVSVSLDNAQERHREIDDQRRTKIPTSQRTKQLQGVGGTIA